MTTSIPSRRFSHNAEIEELLERDIDKLRFSMWSRLSNEHVKQEIASYPGHSVWMPETQEYAIVSAWRHRKEIANVLELSAVRHPAELLNDVVRRSDRLGSNLVVSVEIDEVRSPAFYQRAGFQLIEEVVTYELDCRVAPALQSGRLEFKRADVSRDADRRLLLKLDHATFPWLWWNSDEEFLSYADAPGVELFVGVEGHDPVAYVGISSYLGWGHLDRIAVVPDRQARGLGAEALSFAIGRLMQTGALRVGLSTQRTNTVSQRLYERFGFRRAASNDYRLYGNIIRMPVGVESLTARPIQSASNQAE